MGLLKRFMLTGVLFALNGYVAFHALTGEHGYFSHRELRAQIADATGELAETRAERLSLEARRARLDADPQAGTFDVDYLEELAREKLHFAHPDEVVVTLDAPYAP